MCQELLRQTFLVSLCVSFMSIYLSICIKAFSHYALQSALNAIMRIGVFTPNAHWLSNRIQCAGALVAARDITPTQAALHVARQQYSYGASLYCAYGVDGRTVTKDREMSARRDWQP